MGYYKSSPTRDRLNRKTKRNALLIALIMFYCVGRDLGLFSYLISLI